MLLQKTRNLLSDHLFVLKFVALVDKNGYGILKFANQIFWKNGRKIRHYLDEDGTFVVKELVLIHHD